MLEEVSEVIKVLAWPLVTLVIFFSAKDKVLGSLSRLTTLRSSSVELTFGRQLQAQGLDLEAISSLSALTPDQIELFLLISYSDEPGFHYELPHSRERYAERIRALEHVGLIEIESEQSPGNDVRHRLTGFGKRFRAMLINASTEMLHDQSARS